MWHWMRASLRIAHCGWKLATRVARLAIGVPDYGSCLPASRTDPAPNPPLGQRGSPPRTKRPTASRRETGARL